MSTFTTRLDAKGTGPRLAVKDIIDMEGLPTTAGSQALADRAAPAMLDAPCMAGARAADARIVGRANMTELALSPTGRNPWFGTPVNPLHPDHIPGGSSSGSAVAVATDEADVAFGTDTAASVRLPAACCGVAGLKTTHGRIPLEGVWPLAPSLDTVGPLARDVAGLVLGMELLEPGFTVPDQDAVPSTVGRLVLPADDPEVDAAIDAALAAAGFAVEPVHLPSWDAVGGSAGIVVVAEGWESDRVLVETGATLDEEIAALLAFGSTVTPDQLAEARAACAAWRDELDAALARVDLLAAPTLGMPPPRLDGDLSPFPLIRYTAPINAAGVPAVAVPVPRPGPFPASLQLVGRHGQDGLLLAAAARVEAAVGR